MNQKLLIAVNAAASYSRQIIRMLVLLGLAPYILSRVGTVANGLYLEVIALAAMTAILDVGLSAAVMRFIAREAALEDEAACRQIWMTALLAYLIPCATVLAVIGGGATWIAHLLTHAPEQYPTTVRLLWIGAVMFALEFPANAYRGVLLGLQKHFAIALLEIAAEFLRAAAIVAALAFWTHDIVWVFGITACTTIGCNVALALFVHATCRWARFCRPGLGWARLREILGFSLATFIAQIGYNLNVYMHRLLLGFISGPEAVTRYSFAGQFRDVPETLVMQFTNTMIPVAAKYQATGNVAALQQIMIRGSRYAVIMAGLVAAPIAAFSEPLLRVWLWRTPDMVHLAPLMVCLLGAILLELTRGATHTLLIGMGITKFLGIINLSSVLLDGLIAALLLKVTSLGLYSLLVSTLVAILVRRAVLTWYICGALGLGKRLFMRRCVLTALLPGVVAFSAGRLLQLLYIPTGWFQVIGSGIVAGLVGTAFAAAVILGADERAEVLLPVRSVWDRLRGRS